MYKFNSEISQSEHDTFVEKHPLCNLLQSSKWAKVKDNWDSAIIGVYDDDQLVASSLVLIKKLPLGFTMLYTPRGPIMDYHNSGLVKFFMEEFTKFAKTKRCLFIKMDPGIHLRDFPINEPSEQQYDVTDILNNMSAAGAIHQGFPKEIAAVIQPRFQANVYRSDSFEKDLPRHTRRLIRDAVKRDVQVIIAGQERLHAFSEVVSLTENRKNVSLRNYEYFKLLMDIYGDDAYLFLGEVNVQETLTKLEKQYEENEIEIKQTDEKSRKKLNRLQDIKVSLTKSIEEFQQYPKSSENTVIAGVLSIKFGNTMEMLYAGMNDNFKKFMPQYYIYVENMKYAFNNGCDFCNMGGVDGGLQDGLTKFKANFNPKVNEFIGEFDLPVNKMLYKLSEHAYKLRKSIKSKK